MKIEFNINLAKLFKHRFCYKDFTFMKYYKIIELLKEVEKEKKRHHNDRWIKDRHYTDSEIYEDEQLFIEIDCTINMLEDLMCD